MKKFENPSGTAKISIQSGKSEQILLEDFEARTREFSLEIELLGENSACEVVGRVRVAGDFRKKWKIRCIGLGRNQKISLDLRGVAKNSGELEFDGSAILSKKSDNGEVAVSQKIVAIRGGRGRCEPGLRVETDRVKSASHSASIASWDSAIFSFFSAHGIDRLTAEKMLEAGFLNFEGW